MRSPSRWRATLPAGELGSNCYAFALDETTGPLHPGELAIRYKSDGRSGGKWVRTYPGILALVEMDGLVPLTTLSQLNLNRFPVAVFATDGDVHFIRPDRSGGWWHKLGQQAAKRKRFLPFWAKGYTFCGLYLVDLAVVKSTDRVDISSFATEQAEEVAKTNKEGPLY